MKNRAVQYALLFLISGILLSLFVGYVERKTILTYEHNLPYSSLGETLKTHILRAQKGIALVYQGKGGDNLQAEVLAPLTSSMAILTGAYDGKQTEIGTFIKPEHEDLQIILKEAIVNLDKLIIAAQNSQKAVTISVSEPDSMGNTVTAMNVNQSEVQKTDLLFNQLLASLDRVSLQATTILDSRRASIKWLSFGSVGLLMVISMALAVLVYRLQSHSDKLVTENSERLQEQEQSVHTVSTFIESVSSGNFSIDLKLEGDNNLAKTLLNMRDKLRENAESDRKRNWTTSGLAQIGEILRAHTSTTTELYDNIIRFVIKYTKSNQGGLFLLNEEHEQDKFLELMACYAFERKKFLQKNVVIGEGLIGQCYLEGERIYLLDVPQEYITITSGLGGANPNALLIVPLKVNESIYGVLELASFNRFEEYQIELVEKFAETIASTISTVRINDSTRILLEKTQQQAEEMRAQEEEMRQNMEELEATQEEMRRKEKHIQEMLDSEKKRNEFNNKNRQIVIELSKSPEILQGKWDKALHRMTSAIGNQLRVSRVSVWMYHSDRNLLHADKAFYESTNTFDSGEQLSGNLYPSFFRAVLGEKTVMAKSVRTSPETRELVDSYCAPLDIQSILAVPFFADGKVAGVIQCEQQRQEFEWTDDHVEFLKSISDLLTVATNTVRINTMVLNLSEAQETLQTIIDNLPRAVFWKDRNLNIHGCNRIFANVAGMKSHLDMIGKSDFDMPWKEHAEAYRADDLAVMNSRESRIDQEEKNVNSEGVESWVLTSKVPIINKEGEVVAVLGMFEDITDRKRMENEMSLRLKELEELKKLVENRKN